MQFSMQVVILYHYLLENLACYCKKTILFWKAGHIIDKCSLATFR